MSVRVAISYGSRPAGPRRYHRIHSTFPHTRGACGTFVRAWADLDETRGIPPCRRCYPERRET